MTDLTEQRMAIGLPWSSAAVPSWTLAADRSLTPGGRRAVFRSSPHAWMAIRLAYLAEYTDEPTSAINERENRYRSGWERYVRHGADMAEIARVSVNDLDEAATLWNDIDQHEVDRAFTIAIGEREPYPRNNLATVAAKKFGLVADKSVGSDGRDRPLKPTDNETAWQTAPAGACRGCGTLTISQRDHDRLRRTIGERPDLFDVTPSYVQSNGRAAPLWSSRILIAAKGVADHRVPWSQGGPTTQDNLANTCAGCNYSRNNTSLDTVRVAAYN